MSVQNIVPIHLVFVELFYRISQNFDVRVKINGNSGVKLCRVHHLGTMTFFHGNPNNSPGGILSNHAEC